MRVAATVAAISFRTSQRNLFGSNPKIIIGASDITMLLGAMQNARVALSRSDGRDIHPPGQRRLRPRSVVRSASEGKSRAVSVPGTKVLRPGSAEGRLTGGCLSLVVATLGTPAEVDTTDSILVLEDIDAKPYQIDRMITQLKQAGKFRACAASCSAKC